MTVLRDPALPHQLVLKLCSYDIAVSCNCIERVGGAPLEMRSRWDVPEVWAVYRAHLVEPSLRWGVFDAAGLMRLAVKK